MPRPRNLTPSYRHHSPSGRAYADSTCPHSGVRRSVCLGAWGSPESRAAHARLCGELVAGRTAVLDLTLNEVFVAFLRHAERHYRRPDGTPTHETDNFKAAIAVARVTHGHTPAAAFGPLALKAVRRVRAVFRWGESVEAVPAGKWFQLRSRIGLKSGKSSAPAQRKNLPADAKVVEITCRHLSPTVAAMVRFQRLTGCRPQDVCHLNAAEIDRTADVWEFRPVKHKGAHRGQVRTVYIGPKAQEVIRALVEAAPDAPAVFSPRTAWAEGRQAGTKSKRPNYTPKGPPINVGAVFDTNAYIKAISRGVDRANEKREPDDHLPHWTPNQLRHAAGTSIRDEYGLETAQKILGHKHASTTERYASPTDRAAVEFARENG